MAVVIASILPPQIAIGGNAQATATLQDSAGNSLSWGATAEEQRMVLPGDQATPDQYFTHAITINAPASQVWPWLVQIGQASRSAVH